MKPLTIKADPANPNRMEDADKKRMAASLAEFGDLGGIIINRRTGFLVGGHQRVSVLGDSLEIEDLKNPEPDGTVGRGWITKDGRRYAVRVVDWDEAKAHAALLSANRFGRVGKDDNALLKELLEELDTGAIDMDLTGFDNREIERLMTQYHVEGENDPEKEWEGMPEFDNPAKGYSQIAVHFKSKKEMEEFGKLIGSVITETTRSIWYPVTQNTQSI